MNKSYRVGTPSPAARYVVTAVIVFSVFFLFSTFRQKYVGACDWYGYYSQSLLIKSGQFHMKTELNPKIFPAVAPLGYYVREGKIVPHFPPGFPVLLALFGLPGLEFYLTPIIGTLSFILMFLILSRLTNRHIGLMFSLLWVLSPIVVWGSTHMMSDLAACFFILAAYYLCIKEKPGLSGLVFGFSLLIRPSNIVFILALLPLVITQRTASKKRKLLRFGICFLIITSFGAVYNWLMHGAPWKYGFYDTASLLSSSVFSLNFPFYSTEIIMQFTPFLLLPAFISSWRRKREVYVYWIWFFSFFLFYCFIILGREAWWSIRFLLPALPALFILSALGFKEIEDYITRKWKNKNTTVYIKPAMIVMTVLLLAYFIHFESNADLFIRDKWKQFYDLSGKIAENVPPGSVVGAFEMSGPLRLYSNIESFNFTHAQSARLIKRMLKRKRPVYVVMEPLLMRSPYGQDIAKKLKKFDYEEIKKLSEQKEYYLYRIKRKRLRRQITAKK